MKISHLNMYLVLSMVSAIELSTKMDAEAISWPTFMKPLFISKPLDTLVVSVGFSGNDDKPDDMSSQLTTMFQDIILKRKYCKKVVERGPLDKLLREIGMENFIGKLNQKESTILNDFQLANSFILCKVSRDKGGREITFTAKAVTLDGVIRSASIVSIILDRNIYEPSQLSANTKKEVLQKLASGLCGEYSLKRTVITGTVVAAISTTIWYIFCRTSPSGSIEIVGSFGP